MSLIQEDITQRASICIIHGWFDGEAARNDVSVPQLIRCGPEVHLHRHAALTGGRGGHIYQGTMAATSLKLKGNYD